MVRVPERPRSKIGVAVNNIRIYFLTVGVVDVPLLTAIRRSAPLNLQF